MREQNNIDQAEYGLFQIVSLSRFPSALNQNLSVLMIDEGT